jgi:murein DD-endopeptidase MepM/ murein hydrolase activator NlpD
MNYNTIEIYRLRSRTQHQIMGYRRRRRSSIGLIALPVLTFCATALYASLGIKDPEAPRLEVEVRHLQSDPDLALELSLPATLMAPLTETAAPQSAAPEGAFPPGQEHATEADYDLEYLEDPQESAEADAEFIDTGFAEPGADNGELALEGAAEGAEEAAEETVGIVTEKVRSGDSLAKIFSRLNLSSTLVHDILASGQEAKTLTDIRPGQTFEFSFDAQGEFQEMYFQRSPDEGVRVWRDGGKLASQAILKPVELRSNEVAGTITDSLYLSAKRAGLSDGMILNLANIFGYDIDFALDIRAGDRFSVVFQEEWLEGEKLRNGPLLAAEFVSQGQVYRAIRFEDPEGQVSYYTPQGNGMRTAFIRTPVDFTRISSKFSKERCHPILGVCRPHKGVDYAAPTGTPVKAAGNGKVSFRGSKSGYGNTVIIQHNDSRYNTLYAHLSKFAPTVKEGSRVKQGQVIGYVGATGLATGPHLHYEFRVNGEHRDPLTVKLPKSEPIDKRFRPAFEQHSAQLLARLDNLAASTMYAEAKSGDATQIQ